MSLRTLRFGDRTISYDTGLNSLPPELETKKASAGSSSSATSTAATSSSSPPLRPPSATMRISADQDDGIGSSDDETLSTSSSSSNASTTKGEASDDDAEAEEDDGTNNEETEVPSHKQRPQTYQSPFERDSSPNRDVTRRAKTSMSSTTPTPPDDEGKNNTRKVIRPDPSAIDLLLTFDEEEEDELDEESEQEEEKERKSSQNGWHKTIVKDLATLPSPSSSSSSGRLRRRHSITLCESSPPPSAAQRKSSTGSSTASSSSSSSSASSSASASPRHLSPRQSTADGPHSLMMGGPAPAPYSLNVAEMHSTLSEEVEANAARTRRTFGAKPDALKPKAMETLDLRLDEVAHIRSVMTKVELEALPLDGSIREDVEKGKVCFLCMKTRFGLFSRGQRCEMCKQLVCQRCHSKMRIPTEHFSNTPVFALSPSTPSISEEAESGVGGVGGVPTHPAAAKEKKLSLPDNFMQLTNKSVGSAPSSPTLARRGEANAATLNTISGCLAADGPASAAGPVSLPPAQQTTPPGRGQYATLPKKKSRRMSWISSRDAEREKLEGSLLAVCTDCKDMVLQVIRASRTTRRLHMVQSMFLNLTPDSGSVRQNRL